MLVLIKHVARELNIEICGWCLRGGWVEDYTTPPGLLSDYPELTETPSEGTEVGEREGEHL